jgi:hypothetical protein
MMLGLWTFIDALSSSGFELCSGKVEVIDHLQANFSGSMHLDGAVYLIAFEQIVIESFSSEALHLLFVTQGAYFFTGGIWSPFASWGWGFVYAATLDTDKLSGDNAIQLPFEQLGCKISR